MINKCYQCKWRGEVPGSCHSSCHHPKSGCGDGMGSVFAMLASVRRVGPLVSVDGVKTLNIQGSAHGVRMGWFNWPWNFDPVWLENCDGFESKQPAAELDRQGGKG